MKKYIIQHAIGDQIQLLNLSQPYNQKYASDLGLVYLSDTTSRCPERPYYWEKIAYLQEILHKTEDGNIVVWEDCDSINVGTESVADCLPVGGTFGMVQLRGGLNNSMLVPWYNSGVMVIVNSPTFRAFLQRAWDRGGKDDEVGIVEELKASTDVTVSPIDPKWNCWLNNENLCPNPVIRSWHGVKLANKLTAMQAYIDKLKTKGR